LNGPISRLAVFALVLLGALIVATTYWQAWAAPGLADRRENAIQRVAQFTIERGTIYASDGRTVLARNRERDVNGQTLFFRRYPTGRLAAHVVGYSTQLRSRAGLEQSQNDYLTGSNANLSTLLDARVDKLLGRHVVGNDLVLTLNARAQRVALAALGRRCGAVVALDPRTGRVLVMVSTPSYNPNLVEGRYDEILRTQADCAEPSALLNRATQGAFVPGSTFKVVTAAAALESGHYTMETRKNDPGYCIEYGRRVNNYDTTSPFGSVTLFQAIQYSINSYFCEIGKDLGPGPIVQEMKDFGFYALPPVELPTDELRASGLYRNGKLFEPADQSQVDPGRLAFGQVELQVTPMQMAMVAAGVANRGVVMEPFVVDRVIEPDGDVLTRTRRRALGRTMSASNAAALSSAMVAAVSSGTGTAAIIPGIEVAGKTGTAETGREGRNQTAFIAFAPASGPRVAIAVMLENQTGTGGSTAAPIAKQVMQALLQGP
jgi:peptidoglycan glycosyltransferase